MKNRLTVLCTCLLLATSGFAAELYVATDGVDKDAHDQPDL